MLTSTTRELNEDDNADEADMVTGEKIGVNETEELLDALYASCELEKRKKVSFSSFISVVLFFFFFSYQ